MASAILSGTLRTKRKGLQCDAGPLESVSDQHGWNAVGTEASVEALMQLPRFCRVYVYSPPIPTGSRSAPAS